MSLFQCVLGVLSKDGTATHGKSTVKVQLQFCNRLSNVAYSKVEVRIDCIKEELIESVGTRRNVALYLATGAVRLQIRKHKKCNR